MAKTLRIVTATVGTADELKWTGDCTSGIGFCILHFNIVLLAEPIWWLIFKYNRSIISYLQFQNPQSAENGKVFHNLLDGQIQLEPHSSPLLN